MDTKGRAALLVSVGLVVATGSIALTSVVDLNFTTSPATARLVMSGLVQDTPTSTSPGVSTTVTLVRGGSGSPATNAGGAPSATASGAPQSSRP